MRKWRVRFTLRTMLFVVSVVCLLLGAWIIPSVRQYQAAQLIADRGGVSFLDEHLAVASADWFAGASPYRDSMPARFNDDCATKASWYHHFFKNVTAVYIGGPLDPATVTWADFSRLEVLVVNRQQKMTPASIDEFIRRLDGHRKLRVLDLGAAGVSYRDDQIQILLQNTGLESLSIQTSELSDFAAEQLAKMSKLHTLEITLDRVTQPTFEKLSELKNLESLYLQVFSKPDLDFAALMKLKKLRSLDLGSTVVADDALIKIATLGQLEKLSCDTQLITDHGALALLSLQKLESLSLRQSQLTDRGLKELLTLPKLKSLDLYFTLVTDQGLRQLAKSRKIKSLHIRGPSYEDATLADLQKRGIYVMAEF